MEGLVSTGASTVPPGPALLSEGDAHVPEQSYSGH